MSQGPRGEALYSATDFCNETATRTCKMKSFHEKPVGVTRIPLKIDCLDTQRICNSRTHSPGQIL